MINILSIFQIKMTFNFIILDFIDSFRDFKNLRIVNKEFYKSCMEVWQNYKGKEMISSPRGTMINISCCHICSKNLNKKKRIELLVNYYYHPEPVYIICENWKCIHDCLIDLFYNAWENERVYLNKNNYLPQKNKIPRSNNQKTIANIDYNYIIISCSGKLLVRCYWFDDNGQYTKDVDIKHFNKKNNKTKISSWYKNYKDLNLKELNEKINNY